jgi:hypothetical protein
MTATGFEYIEEFYNRNRLHSTPCHKSPVRYLVKRINAWQAEKLVA